MRAHSWFAFAKDSGEVPGGQCVAQAGSLCGQLVVETEFAGEECIGLGTDSIRQKFAAGAADDGDALDEPARFADDPNSCGVKAVLQRLC